MTASAQPTEHGLALQVEGLRVSYGRKRAVDGVSLNINEGEIFGLLGPNGGKTSTLSAIEGLVRPDSGSIRIGDVDARANPAAARARMGVQLLSRASNPISRSARSSGSTQGSMASTAMPSGTGLKTGWQTQLSWLSAASARDASSKMAHANAAGSAPSKTIGSKPLARR